MGVAGRVSVGIIVLMVGVVLLFTALTFEPAFAQPEDQDAVSGDQNNNQNDACPGANEVASIGPDETESQQRTFSVTGDSFRVNYDVALNNESSSVIIRALDQDGGLIDFETVSETSDDVFVVLDGPADFEVEVDVDGEAAEYTVTVEDCAGTDNGDDGDANDDGVIDDTVPDKDLPNTGGFPLIVAGGIFLFSAFGVLAAWRHRKR